MLYSEVCPHCGESHPQSMELLPKELTDKLDEEGKKLIQKIYDGEEYSDNVLQVIGEHLTKVVADNYTKITADFTTPDTVMLTELRRNVWHFSAAKNYNELKDLSIALRDEKGKLKSFEDFEESAARIVEKYNKTWLRTEYNLAVASAQNAARWADFEKEKDVLPILQYQTVGDEHVRHSHAMLNGVKKRIDDPFWNTHFPPNGYGCRCEVIQSTEKSVTPNEKTPNIEIPALFRTNLAKTGLIFPQGHAYYDGIPEKDLRKAIAYLPPRILFMPDNGDKRLLVHPLHGKDELPANLAASKILLKHKPNAKIKIMPILYEQDYAAKPLYLTEEYMKKFPNKNPDILYNNKPADIKNVSNSKSSINNGIRKGKRQADFVILHLSEDTIMEEAVSWAKQTIKSYKGKKNTTLWLLNDQEIIELRTRKSIKMRTKNDDSDK